MSSNVMLILKELEQAKSTLSDIQSILKDIDKDSTSKSGTVTFDDCRITYLKTSTKNTFTLY